MGAWGYGPFDGDAALDYLADVAADADVVDIDAPDRPVDQATVLALLHGTLTGTRADAAARYAAAGLVAAALVGTTTRSTGTRLFAAIEDARDGTTRPATLGLDAHCGYVALLTPQTAADLTAEAAAAVDALRADTAWLATWTAPASVIALLDQMAATLATTTGGATGSDGRPA